MIPYEFDKGTFATAEQITIEMAMHDLARQVRIILFILRSNHCQTCPTCGSHPTRFTMTIPCLKMIPTFTLVGLMLVS
jgi:hypothetical protein